jgi:glycosyltransferase involved in cell wall biosynthesis
MNILYIGPRETGGRNGGEMIEERNQKLLEIICNGEVVFFAPNMRYQTYREKIAMCIGLTNERRNALKEIIKNKHFDLVFISQSYFGGYAKYIKKISPIPIVTFFHNAEIAYFFSARKKDKQIWRGFYYIAKVILNEFLAVRRSDKLITLNQRDSIALKKYYGRGSDFIMPTTFIDSFNENNAKNSIFDIDYLFVGSCFFANTEGLQWFIDKVLPYVKGDLYVVGNGMDKFGFSNLSDRIHISGFVNDLSNYYNRAKIVVSPIFSGSGMKTKTAEALMYGKIIVGTKEAFEGYIINSKCMKLCNTAEDFIEELNYLYSTKMSVVNRDARVHFQEYYKNEVLIPPLENFLKSCVVYDKRG